MGSKVKVNAISNTQIEKRVNRAVIGFLKVEEREKLITLLEKINNEPMGLSDTFLKWVLAKAKPINGLSEAQLDRLTKILCVLAECGSVQEKVLDLLLPKKNVTASLLFFYDVVTQYKLREWLGPEHLVVLLKTAPKKKERVIKALAVIGTMVMAAKNQGVKNPDAILRATAELEEKKCDESEGKYNSAEPVYYNKALKKDADVLTWLLACPSDYIDCLEILKDNFPKILLAHWDNFVSKDASSLKQTYSLLNGVLNFLNKNSDCFLNLREFTDKRVTDLLQASAVQLEALGVVLKKLPDILNRAAVPYQYCCALIDNIANAPALWFQLQPLESNKEKWSIENLDQWKQLVNHDMASVLVEKNGLCFDTPNVSASLQRCGVSGAQITQLAGLKKHALLTKENIKTVLFKPQENDAEHVKALQPLLAEMDQYFLRACRLGDGNSRVSAQCAQQAIQESLQYKQAANTFITNASNPDAAKMFKESFANTSKIFAGFRNKHRKKWKVLLANFLVGLPLLGLPQLLRSCIKGNSLFFRHTERAKQHQSMENIVNEPAGAVGARRPSIVASG